MARPGLKHWGTSCPVDNAGNKAGLGAGAAPRADGRPQERGAPGAGGPGPGAPGGRALQPASWGFCKYLPSKETTAFAFPVIVAPALPPWVQAGEAPGPALPTALPPALTSPTVGPGPGSGEHQGGTDSVGLSRVGPRAIPHQGHRNLAPHLDTGRPLLLVTWGQPHLRDFRCMGLGMGSGGRGAPKGGGTAKKCVEWTPALPATAECVCTCEPDCRVGSLAEHGGPMGQGEGRVAPTWPMPSLLGA